MATTADAVIGQLIKEKEDTAVQLGAAGSVIFQFNVLQDSIVPRELFIMVRTRGPGSSFILANPGLGWVGPEVAGSVTAGSQPYLGDSRDAFTLKSLTSPENTFIDFFAGSRFESGTTTADWNTGSSALFFLSGNVTETEAVHLGDSNVTQGVLTVAGSTVDNLNLFLAADGSSFESVTNLTPHVFTTIGSEVRWKANATGSARVDSVKVVYA